MTNYRRKIRKGRCQVLDQDGKRCRRKATHSNAYHGDGELYGALSGKPQWVTVKFCDKHDLG